MGFILDKNSENAVLCTFKVYVASTQTQYCLHGQTGGTDRGQERQCLDLLEIPSAKAFTVHNHISACTGE
eukprot:12217535-Ditylum_brightwellii.AAC.1